MLMPYGEMDGQQRSRLANANAVMTAYEEAHGKPGAGAEPDPEAVARLPEYEKALALLQRAVANGERDLAAADHAATKLKELEDTAAEAIDLEPLQARLAELTAKRDGWRADADKYRALAEQAARRQGVVDQAAALHADVLAWTSIADALSPDGIPDELLAAALDPINRRLFIQACDAQWPVPKVPNIGEDMTITVGGRPYALASESEQWRADALIAEAIAHLSGLRLLVLDRADVLDLTGREDLLYWLSGLAVAGEIDTALVFATLKSLPAELPEGIAGVWIENGIAGQMREAA